MWDSGSHESWKSMIPWELKIYHNLPFRRSKPSLRGWGPGCFIHSFISSVVGCVVNCDEEIRTRIQQSTYPKVAFLVQWEDWLMTWRDREDSAPQGATELLVRTINLCAGRSVSKELLSHPHYVRLATCTHTLCHRLSRLPRLIDKVPLTSSLQLILSGSYLISI